MGVPKELESVIFPAWGAMTFAGCSRATICGLPAGIAETDQRKRGIAPYHL